MNPFAIAVALSALAAPAQPAPSTCSLLDAAELESIQSGKVVEAKAGARPERGFQAGQCFYRLEPFSRSVSLDVTRPEAAAGRSLDERWQSLFHPEGREENGREEEREEKSSVRPVPVTGLGREAFWLPNHASGALYVLGPQFYFRVSVGGGDTNDAKLAKSKALAGKVLARLAAARR